MGEFKSDCILNEEEQILTELENKIKELDKKHTELMTDLTLVYKDKKEIREKYESVKKEIFVVENNIPFTIGDSDALADLKTKLIGFNEELIDLDDKAVLLSDSIRVLKKELQSYDN